MGQNAVIFPKILTYTDTKIVDSISDKLLGRPVDKIKVEDSPSEWVGEPPEDEDLKLFSSDDTTVDSFFDPDLPLPGQAGIIAASKKTPYAVQ